MEEISLYSQKDQNCAAARLRRCALALACMLLPMIVLYVFAILKGLRLLMLGALLAAFVCAMIHCDFYLLPARRYLSFLTGLKSGLRRELDCILDGVSKETELQDGAFVHAVHVRLSQDGQTRIFYVNASKRALLPPGGSRLRLTSCGRHIVSFKLF